MQVGIGEKLEHYLVHGNGKKVRDNPFELVAQVIPEISAVVEHGRQHIRCEVDRCHDRSQLLFLLKQLEK